MKITRPPTTLRIITFRKSFINLKSTQNITLQYPGLDVKHSLHTCKCGFSYFRLLYVTKQDAYHRRKHESRIRTSTALIAREINMRELKQNSQHFS